MDETGIRTMKAGGISAENRSLLQLLHQKGPGPFSVVDAAEIWALTASRAGRLMRSLAAGGWLMRVRRGLYIPVPLEATRPGEWHEDPWIVAAKLFPSGYVGGWSAAEYWSLTDQVFRDILVFSPRRARSGTVNVGATALKVKYRGADRIFGLASVWRRSIKVAVSDPTRTVVDVLNTPSDGGGIRHVVEVVNAYFGSEHRDDARLIEYATRLGNGAVFKRLGFVVESLQLEAPRLIEECRTRRSRGVTQLDPAVKACGRIDARWSVRVNADIER